MKYIDEIRLDDQYRKEQTEMAIKLGFKPPFLFWQDELRPQTASDFANEDAHRDSELN